MRLRFAIVSAATALGLAAVGAVVPVEAQQPAPSGDLRVLPVRGNVFLISGAGANITASVGKDGVMLVDTGSTAMAEKTLAIVRELSRRVTASPMPMKSCVGVTQGCPWWSSSELLPTTTSPRAPRPISFIINTSDDPNDVGGNAVIGQAGHTYGIRNLDNTTPGAAVVAHENATLRMSKAGLDKFLASESYGGRDKKLNFFNGEGVVVTHPDSAHTDGDSIVYFRGSDVLAVGDVISMTNYPVIDAARGGTINGLVETLNWILDICVVEHMMEGGTADPRLRRPIRQEPAVDPGDVRRGDLPYSPQDFVGHRACSGSRPCVRRWPHSSRSRSTRNKDGRARQAPDKARRAAAAGHPRPPPRDAARRHSTPPATG